jgi:hypothetical protein
VRTIALALVTLAAVTAPARADVIPQFVGVPGTYVPGTPFTFELRAPGLTAFTDFNFDLIVGTTSPDPVTLLSVSADRPGDAEYAFGASGTFSTSQSAVPGSSEFTVNIAGTSSGGVNTTGGAPDLLARITVNPTTSLSEPIMFSIDAGTYSVNALSETGQALQPPDQVTVFPADVPPTGTPVPGPGGVVLLGVGGLLLLARKRFAGRA